MARVTEWMLGIIGAIAAFMGGVIMWADADQYIGLGGDLTWRVGDIESAWGYGLLIGGAVILVVSMLLAMSARRRPRANQEENERTGLLTHIAVFVVVNGLLWAQDIIAGGGLEYAYWATIPWGAGLVAHIIAYLSGGRHAPTPHPIG